MAAAASPVLQGACQVFLGTTVEGNGCCQTLRNSHAILAVKGIVDNAPFFGTYELYSITNPPQDQRTFGWKVQKTLGNTMGTIRVLVEEAFGAQAQEKEKEFHASLHSYTPYTKTALQVNPMIAQIHAQVGKELPYQTAGCDRLSIFGGNGKDNCLTWAKKMAKIAGIASEWIPTDSVKAIPRAATDPDMKNQIYAGFAVAILAVIGVTLAALKK